MNGTEAEIRVLRIGIIKKQNGWNVNSGLQRKAEIRGVKCGMKEKSTENGRGFRKTLGKYERAEKR